MFPPNSDAGTVETVLNRITGQDVRVVELQPGSWSSYYLDPSNNHISIAWHQEDPAAAGRAYLEVNLQYMQKLKMREQSGRCLLCGSPGPLQLDHIEERSHGRDDTPGNLRLICAKTCHPKKTGQLQWSERQL